MELETPCKSQVLHDDLNLSRGSKIEETDRLLPVVRRANDFVADKSSGSVEEREEFPEEFDTYLRKKLNWSRLEYDGDDSRVSGWVFWDRQDDRPKTLPVSDFENVDVFPNARPKLEDKIRLALERIILHPQYGQSLVQFWAPSRTLEGRTLLQAQNQPFGLGKVGRSAWGLCKYRIKSMDHKFYGDIGESGEEELGLLGRVFLYKLPESTSDVQYYSLKEYPQLHDASFCQVKASWALPVFEQSSQVCIGVLELVSTVDAIADWCDKSFLHNLCNVFQELGLQSSDVHKHYEIKCKDEGKEALTTAFHELTLLLELVYESHKLPLALTWVPCNACDALLLCQRSSNGGEYLQSFKANDNHLVESLIASTRYHLRKGHVAEMVLGSTSMSYCSDVTQFNIADYPLVPFARQFKLTGCFTVCLRSSYTGEYVYMLEFFLPASSKDNDNTLTQVSTILGTMKTNSRTFKLASGEELGEVSSVEIFDFHNGQRHQYPQMIQASLELLKNGDDEMDVINAEQDDTVAAISKRGTTKSQEREHKKIGVRFNISLEDVLRFSALSRRDAAERLKVSESTLKRVCRKHGIHRWPPRDLNKEEVFPLALPNVEDIGHLDSPEEMEVDATKYGPHDVRTESTDHSRPSSSHLENESVVTIENLQQHFGHRREDAARSLGVSVSTMKRICRWHGIKRWPYQQNGGGAMKQLDSDQPSMDAVNNGRSFIGANHSNLDATFSEEGSSITQERKKGKTGVKIETPLEEFLQNANMRLDNVERKFKVISSSLKRVRRHYGIHRGPPRNIDDVGAPQPSHDVPRRSLDKGGAPQPSLVELQEGISELTSDRPLASDSRDSRIHLGPPPNRNKVGAPGPSHVEHRDRSSQLTPDMPSNQTPLREEGILQSTLDRPSNQVLDGVAHVKPRDTALQDTKTVTIRAKYVKGFTIKYQSPK